MRILAILLATFVISACGSLDHKPVEQVPVTVNCPDVTYNPPTIELTMTVPESNNSMYCEVAAPEPTPVKETQKPCVIPSMALLAQLKDLDIETQETRDELLEDLLGFASDTIRRVDKVEAEYEECQK